jgi:hypothetical protein
LAVTVDPLGQYVAVADERGNLHVFNRDGEALRPITCPRPLHHLAFIPEKPLLETSADYGFVGAFDLAGNCAWRDGLVSHVGGLAVTGDGSQVVLACFSDGLQRYGEGGRRLERLPLQEPARLVSMDFAGKHLLVGGSSKRVLLLGEEGKVSATQELEQPVVALALGPLGDYAVAALADGKVVKTEW